MASHYNQNQSRHLYAAVSPSRNIYSPFWFRNHNIPLPSLARQHPTSCFLPVFECIVVVGGRTSLANGLLFEKTEMHFLLQQRINECYKRWLESAFQWHIIATAADENDDDDGEDLPTMAGSLDEAVIKFQRLQAMHVDQLKSSNICGSATE